MSEVTSAEIYKDIDETLNSVDENGKQFVAVEKGNSMYEALALAYAVSKLVDFGGGLLRLKSGHKFKLLRPCSACEVAAPIMLPRGAQSDFCARCADNLAAMYTQALSDENRRLRK